ncbi:MAG: SH3 domain-containing protein [Acidobacteriota bacterium]
MSLDKRIAAALFFAGSLACAKPAPELPPIRESIGTRYVVSSNAGIRKSPDPAAPVINSYRSGEAVSVLSTKEDWTEIRMGDLNTGWVHTSDLGEGQDVLPREELKFRRAPSPIYSTTKARGLIVLLAQVNTHGEVESVKTLQNTTGNPQLEEQNSSELKKATFFPLLVSGRVRAFEYEYKIEY